MNGSEPKNLILKRIINKICVVIRTLKPNFLHVLRENNTEADKMVNEAIGRPLGTLGVEGIEGLTPLV
jgi:hypothetical protein